MRGPTPDAEPWDVTFDSGDETFILSGESDEARLGRHDRSEIPADSWIRDAPRLYAIIGLGVFGVKRPRSEYVERLADIERQARVLRDAIEVIDRVEIERGPIVK